MGLHGKAKAGSKAANTPPGVENLAWMGKSMKKKKKKERSLQRTQKKRKESVQEVERTPHTGCIMGNVGQSVLFGPNVVIFHFLLLQFWKNGPLK